MVRGCKGLERQGGKGGMTPKSLVNEGGDVGLEWGIMSNQMQLRF